MIYFIAIVLGVALLASSLTRRPKNLFLAGLAVLSIAVVSIMWIGGLGFSIGINFAGLLLAVTVGTFIGALVTSKSIWGIAFLVFFGSYIWLCLGATAWVFVLFVLAAVFAAVEDAKRTTLWGLMTVIAVIAAMLLATGSGITAQAQTVSQAVASAAQQQKQEFTNPSVDLTIKAGMMLPTAALCSNDDRFSENSLKPVGPKGRTYADSDSTPFTPGSPAAHFTQYTSENCVNMTTTDAAIQALSAAPKIGSFSIYQANKGWMNTFMTKTTKSPLGLGVWLTQKLDKNGKIILDANGHPARFVTAEFQGYAEMVNTILLGLDNQGVKTARSVANWPSHGTLAADVLPRVFEAAPNKQEDEPFLALTFTTKAGEACPFVLGINVLDKRPEFFGCSTARVIAPETVTQPRQQQRERAASPAAPAPAGVTPSRNVTPQAPATPVAPKPSSTTPPTTPTTVTTTPPAPPTTTTTTPPVAPPTTTPPQVCYWKNGSVHELVNGLCPKESSLTDVNPSHDPRPSESVPASKPTHPTQTANPTTTPGSPSTQQAPGATQTPTQTATVPPVEVTNGTTNPGTGYIDPNTGKPYTP